MQATVEAKSFLDAIHKTKEIVKKASAEGTLKTILLTASPEKQTLTVSVTTPTAYALWVIPANSIQPGEVLVDAEFLAQAKLKEKFLTLRVKANRIEFSCGKFSGDYAVSSASVSEFRAITPKLDEDKTRIEISDIGALHRAIDLAWFPLFGKDNAYAKVKLVPDAIQVWMSNSLGGSYSDVKSKNLVEQELLFDANMLEMAVKMFSDRASLCIGKSFWSLSDASRVVRLPRIENLDVGDIKQMYQTMFADAKPALQFTALAEDLLEASDTVNSFSGDDTDITITAEPSDLVFSVEKKVGTGRKVCTATHIKRINPNATSFMVTSDLLNFLKCVNGKTAVNFTVWSEGAFRAIAKESEYLFPTVIS